MFLTSNIPALLKSVTLKQDEDGNRFAYCKFIHEPFFAPLAREIGEEVASHLFDDDDQLRSEVKDMGFNLRVPLQKLTVREHVDLPPRVVLDTVGIESIKVSRPDLEKPRLRLEFVCVVPIVLQRTVIEFLVTAFGTACRLTFEALQDSLLNNEKPAPKPKDDVTRH